MTLPNEFQAPTAANLSRATITELAVYVYQTALNFTGNAQYAETVLREFVTRAEAASEDARNAATNAATDAAQIAAQTIRDIVSADADRAQSAAQNASESEQNTAADAENAAESATNATVAADRAEAAARTAAADAVAAVAPAAADAIREEVQEDAAAATSAAERAEIAARSAETSESVCDNYAGGAANSAEAAAQSASAAAQSASTAQSAAENAAQDVEATLDEKISTALAGLSTVLTPIDFTVSSGRAVISNENDGLYLFVYVFTNAIGVQSQYTFICHKTSGIDTYSCANDYVLTEASVYNKMRVHILSGGYVLLETGTAFNAAYSSSVTITKTKLKIYRIADFAGA